MEATYKEVSMEEAVDAVSRSYIVIPTTGASGPYMRHDYAMSFGKGYINSGAGVESKTGAVLDSATHLIIPDPKKPGYRDAPVNGIATMMCGYLVRGCSYIVGPRLYETFYTGIANEDAAILLDSLNWVYCGYSDIAPRIARGEFNKLTDEEWLEMFK